MSLLTKNTVNSERLRGCIFAENFESNAAVTANGGTVTGLVTIDNSVTFGGTGANYIQYDISEWGPTLEKFSFVCKASQDNDTNFKRLFTNDGTDLEFYSRDGESACTFRINSTAFTSDTGLLGVDEEVNIGVSYDGANIRFYRNGVQHGADQPYSTDITLNTSGVFFISDDSSSTSFNGGTLKNFKCFNKGLTAGEMLDYANNSTDNYRNEAIGDWQFKMENHDPTNLRTLDVSGDGYHATFGDGSTPTTYPTKLAKRGYNFDGTTDYLSVADNAALRTASVSVIALIKPGVDTGRNMMVVNGDPSNYATLNYSFELLASTGLALYARTDSVNILASDVVSPGTYHVVAFTNDGVTTKLYVDGELKASGAQAVGTDDTTGIYIGRYPLAAFPFTGNILSVQQYDFVLTPMQIADASIDMMKKLNNI